MIVVAAALLLAQAKPTLIVMPPTQRVPDTIVARRAEAFVEALRRNLAADTTIFWMPHLPAERPRDKNGRFIVARYMVETSADTAGRGRVKIDVHAVNVETTGIDYRQTVTVGRD